ncbi:hypothetical protein BH24PSE2_BH24PSE2_10650 [soil metagenome]
MTKIITASDLTELVPVEAPERRNPAAERSPAGDAETHSGSRIGAFFRPDAHRREAIHASLKLFQRYPQLDIFFIERPNERFKKRGWYSCIKMAAKDGNGAVPMPLGPFATHLEARNAWLGR